MFCVCLVCRFPSPPTTRSRRPSATRSQAATPSATCAATAAPLHDFKGNKAIVLVFVGAECPVSNLYLPGLVELEKKYREQAGAVPRRLPQRRTRTSIASPATPTTATCRSSCSRTSGRQLADALGVTRVPTVAVLDGDHVLRYRGRVDDRYGAAARRPKATRADLAEALDEVLAGKKVSVAETEADGCLIGRRGQDDDEDRRHLQQARRADPAEPLPGLPPPGPDRPPSRC